MIQLQQILHPTDFSPASREALNYALALAARFDARLHVLHVLPDASALAIGPAGFVPAGLPEIQEQLRQEHEQEAGKLLADWVADSESLTQPVERATRSGTTFMEIIRYARDADVDLIVIGTHGRTGLSHVLMGSVAEKVVQKSTCPVLTIRPEGHQFVMP